MVNLTCTYRGSQPGGPALVKQEWQPSCPGRRNSQKWIRGKATNALLPREIGNTLSAKHNGHRKWQETREIKRGTCRANTWQLKHPEGTKNWGLARKRIDSLEQWHWKGSLDAENQKLHGRDSKLEPAHAPLCPKVCPLFLPFYCAPKYMSHTNRQLFLKPSYFIIWEAFLFLSIPKQNSAESLRNDR